MIKFFVYKYFVNLLKVSFYYGAIRFEFDDDTKDEEFIPHPYDQNRIEILANIYGYEAPVFVSSFEDEKVRAAVINPEEVVIPDEKFVISVKKDFYTIKSMQILL